MYESYIITLFSNLHSPEISNTEKIVLLSHLGKIVMKIGTATAITDSVPNYSRTSMSRTPLGS